MSRMTTSAPATTAGPDPRMLLKEQLDAIGGLGSSRLSPEEMQFLTSRARSGMEAATNRNLSGLRARMGTQGNAYNLLASGITGGAGADFAQQMSELRMKDRQQGLDNDFKKVGLKGQAIAQYSGWLDQQVQREMEKKRMAMDQERLGLERESLAESRRRFDQGWQRSNTLLGLQPDGTRPEPPQLTVSTISPWRAAAPPAGWRF